MRRDWADIEVLEEFNDARNFAAVTAGRQSLPTALAGVHSRRDSGGRTGTMIRWRRAGAGY
jgi:hypothetical protein